MNIETQKTNFNEKPIPQQTPSKQTANDGSKDFVSELGALKKPDNSDVKENIDNTDDKNNADNINNTDDKNNKLNYEKIGAEAKNGIDTKVSTDKNNENDAEKVDINVNLAVNDLQGVFNELNHINNKDDVNLNKFNELNHEDDIKEAELKPFTFDDDNDIKKEDLGLIDNNMNIQEPKEKINLQMGANMQFNSDGQPFAEFVNQKEVLKTTEKDKSEEKAILSTMEENIAIANKNILIAQNEETQENKTKTVTNEQGIKKVDAKTNIEVETIVKYDTVVMDKNDVEFFTNLVNNGLVDLNTVKNKEHGSQVSKTLADLLAKAMENNKPVRIDFDNNISVIIRIDRAGKISADFLPSSQVAEAYLKENLPLLKQRFDENNIDYNELNQRKQKQDTSDRKKGRKDE